MTLAALAIVGVALVVLGLGAAIWALGRQVRHLQSAVQVRAQSHEPALREEPHQPVPASSHDAGDLVLTPTPIGPGEVEPDLSVSRIVSVTLAGPLIKVAAFSHGVRRALGEETRMRVAYAFRKELRRQRKVRRKRAAAGPPRKVGQRP